MLIFMKNRLFGHFTVFLAEISCFSVIAVNQSLVWYAKPWRRIKKCEW